MILAAHAVSAVGESVQSYAPCQYGLAQYDIAAAQEWPSDRTNVIPRELRVGSTTWASLLREGAPIQPVLLVLCLGGLYQPRASTDEQHSHRCITTHGSDQVARCVSQHWYLSVQTALADRAAQVQWSRSQGHLKAPLLQPDEVSVEKWTGPVAVIL